MAYLCDQVVSCFVLAPAPSALFTLLRPSVALDIALMAQARPGINLAEDLGPQMVLSSSICSALATLAVGLRMLCKYLKKTGLTVSDYLIIVALVFAWAFTINGYIGMRATAMITGGGVLSGVETDRLCSGASRPGQAYGSGVHREPKDDTQGNPTCASWWTLVSLCARSR